MTPLNNQIFSIDNFEGPLDLLWQLISRQEIDVHTIFLSKLTDQFLKTLKLAKNLDNGAEFISLAASLIWYKSKILLPQHEQHQDLLSGEEETDPHFEVIHQVLDYCRFKQAAKVLAQKEQQQASFYLRGINHELEIKKNLGIEHLSLDDLALLFQQLLSKVPSHTGVIHEEVWRVSDKLLFLRNLLHTYKSVSFQSIFSSEKSRQELIVLFLALLELMKTGELQVVNDRIKNSVCIILADHTV